MKKNSSSESSVSLPRTTYWFTESEENLPEDFVPIRLVLVPSSMSVDIRRTTVLLGRHSEADVRLPLPDVSRRHCRLMFQNGEWTAFDLQSLNGVYLNERQIEKSARVEIGDHIRIGGFTFRVDLLEGGRATNENKEERMLLSIFRALPGREPRRPAA